MTISIEEMMQKYNTDAEHANQVKEYCEKLVSSLEGIIDFSKNEKRYLYAAALLHDIGYAIAKKSHHKHSLELIKQHELTGFSKDETDLIANIARYHRNSLPDETNHPHFAQLSQNDKKTVKKTASILKIADGMDKPHKNLILRLKAQKTPESIDFYVKTVGFKPNLSSAKEKSDLFESTFETSVNFIVI